MPPRPPLPGYPTIGSGVFFNWRIISLQCYVGFCCRTTQISHNCIYIPSILSFLPCPHPTPLGHHLAPGWAPLLYSSFLLVSYFPHDSVYKRASLTVQLIKNLLAMQNPGSIPGSGRSAGEGIGYPLQYSWASPVAQLVKNLPAMR